MNLELSRRQNRQRRPPAACTRQKAYRWRVKYQHKATSARQFRANARHRCATESCKYAPHSLRMNLGKWIA